MHSGNIDYHDLGADYYLRRDPQRERRRAITALNKLGYAVTLDPIEAPAYRHQHRPPLTVFIFELGIVGHVYSPCRRTCVTFA
jgi:hypothetical protein